MCAWLGFLCDLNRFWSQIFSVCRKLINIALLIYIKQRTCVNIRHNIFI